MKTLSKGSLSLEFCTNMFGTIKPEIKKRLQSVIDNPCSETWDNAYTIIICKTKFITLWQAVSEIDKESSKITKNFYEQWAKVPSRETIIKAIQKYSYQTNLN